MIDIESLRPYNKVMISSRDISYPPRIRFPGGIASFDRLIEEFAEISGPTNPNLMGACFAHGEAFLLDSESTHLYCPSCYKHWVNGNERMNN